MRGGQEEKKAQKMVRSSIACARCRRSKVKCVNTGIGSACKACSQSNRECTYPVAGSTPAPKRSEAPPGIKQEADVSESKKRIRKAEDPAARRNSQRVEEHVLESPVLTRKVWDELYEIFKLHFSTEMSFLHPPTFRNRMRQASFPRDPSAPSDLGDGKVLLLGVLTLTARFHAGLVAHHSPTTQDPLAASEFYAKELAAAFGPTIRNLTNPSLENIQALLMLGLYEWGQTRGLSAWLYVGLAIRLAFSMGLAYEDDSESNALPSASPTSKRAVARQVGSLRDDAIEKEVRRRTLWSCFIMDRMLAAGKFRPTMMSVDKLRVQLPCSDDQFLFVHDVQTGFLNSDWLDSASSEPKHGSVSDDGVLGRYIRLVDIFGRLSEWSYAGGRRTETQPPWDASTEFYQLRRQLRDFNDALPSNLTCTEANLSAHIEKRNATTYASLHTLYALCLIMLHREYIPFIPLRCDKPVGPLDPPTFPKEKFQVPNGFWEESAGAIMKASRDIIDIVSTCQDNDALPESPQVAFAVWQAAFVSLYASHFSHMDTGKYLPNGDGQNGDVSKQSFHSQTEKLLRHMVPRLKMVKGYLKSLGKMHAYFRTVLHQNFSRFKRKPEWTGGGLEQYKIYERELKEFGALKDTDMASDGSDTVDQTRSRASTNEIPGATSNGEAMQGIEAGSLPRPNGAWAPINAASPPAEVDERSNGLHSKYNNYTGPHPYGMPTNNYHHSPNQSSSSPSIIASNGDTTSGLNSPYGNPMSQQYHNPAQTQHHHTAYASVAQHTMPPPNQQVPYAVGNEIAYEQWIKIQEGISMNTGFDNFAQEGGVETWVDMPGSAQNPNYMQAIFGVGTGMPLNATHY